MKEATESSARLTRAKLRRVTMLLGGQNTVARLLHVDRSRVSRWLCACIGGRGEAACPLVAAGRPDRRDLGAA